MVKNTHAPELSGNEVPKVRTCKDGTKRYYTNGILHREPTHGPAVEEPDGSGDCYVQGVLQEAKWFCGRYFENQEALDVSIAPPEMRVEEIVEHTIASKNGGKQPRKPTPVYLKSGVSTATSSKPKDPFNKLGARVHGSSMADLQTLYSALTDKQSGTQSG